MMASLRLGDLRRVASRRGPQPITVAPAPGDWSLTDAARSGELRVELHRLPDGVGDLVLGVEYARDGGAWTASGLAGPGAFTLSGLANGVAVSLALRLSGAAGPGPGSEAKTAAPTGAPDAFDPSAWRIEPGATESELLLWIDSLPGTGGAAITGLELSLDDGAAQTLSGGAALGRRVVTVAGPGTYAAAVRALNAAGAGPWSARKLAVVAAPAPTTGAIFRSGAAAWGLAA